MKCRFSLLKILWALSTMQSNWIKLIRTRSGRQNIEALYYPYGSLYYPYGWMVERLPGCPRIVGG